MTPRIASLLIATVACGGCDVVWQTERIHDNDPSMPDANGQQGVPDSSLNDTGLAQLDGAPIDARSIVTLSETTDSTVSPGAAIACYAPGNVYTLDGQWRRAFRPSDFGIVTDFHVTGISFGVERAKNAHAVAVKIAIYTGAVGPTVTSIDTSLMTTLTNATIDVPDSELAQIVTLTILGTIPAGDAFIIQIGEASLMNVGHFILGSTTAGEVMPGYFASAGCAFEPPKNIDVNGQMIINVTGQTE